MSAIVSGEPCPFSLNPVPGGQPHGLIEREMAEIVNSPFFTPRVAAVIRKRVTKRFWEDMERIRRSAVAQCVPEVA